MASLGLRCLRTISFDTAKIQRNPTEIDMRLPNHYPGAHDVYTASH